jgi:sensor histidine kinase regulating citrate/malate metabolism
MFLGATVGGYLSHRFDYAAVFLFCAVLMLIWFLLAFGMKTPLSVKTKMYHMQGFDSEQANALQQQVATLTGVHEAVAIAQEHMLIVKLNNQMPEATQVSTEQMILKLIGSK